MLLSKLVGERTKENPTDAQIRSHALLVRAGFIKLVANGIWSLAMPAKRICQKIEKIVREEMDAIDGQEVSFPVVMPRELWEESGRYLSIGDEMVRFKDRADRDLVLGMTHEEAAVHLCKHWVSSYQQLPFMIYQFQTKFRDEARSRGGLIRVREFVMKDAYSFHSSIADLEAYYEKVYAAYNNIFSRIGLKKFVAVKSDSGMMGGSIAHEYMLLTPAGEDTIVLCGSCDYKANIEVAETKRPQPEKTQSQSLAEVFTADKAEIAEIAEYLNIEPKQTIKAVSYNIKGSEELVVAFTRGDLEINEAKLKKVIKKDIVPANLADTKALYAGNIGPIGLNNKNMTLVFDASLKGANNMVTGANKPEYHLTGVDVARDVGELDFYDISKVQENDICPVCGGSLHLENGIEVGNIFQLGTKYTKSMDMTILDRDGNTQHPIMGCYGIGIGRALASVAEESNDEFGLIWPMSIAPWQVYLCGLRLDDKDVRSKADALYQQMKDAGIEVIYDDRDVSAGVKFSDCDLMGIPLRVVISPRSLANNEVEIQARDRSQKKSIDIREVTTELIKIIQK
jgi:prolyl-tRNA synthetase